MGIIEWIRDYLHDIGSSFSKTSKNIVLTAFFWVIVLGLAISIATGIMIGTQVHNRTEQTMATYWQNHSETNYRQMSVFAKGIGVGSSPKTATNSDDYLTLESIEVLRENIDAKISENKKKAEPKNKNAKDKKAKQTQTNWTDCYSTTFDTSAVYTLNRVINGEETKTPISFNANIVAVGGNFKAFHPYEYLSGGFLPIEEVDENSCVINDSLAWKLFKSYDITGEKINMFGEDYTIIGVVREKDSSIDLLSGSQDYRIFCYFSKMSDLNEKGRFALGDPDNAVINPLAITCYEAMLPEIVKGVAKTDVLTSLKSYNASEPQYIILSNTGRYSISNVYDENMPVGEKQKTYSQYDFPYWEKAAQLTAQRLFIEGVAFVFGIVLILIGITICILQFSSVKFKKNTEQII